MHPFSQSFFSAFSTIFSKAFDWQPPTVLFQYTAVFQRLNHTSLKFRQNSDYFWAVPHFSSSKICLRLVFTPFHSSTTACKYIPLAAIATGDNWSHISTFN